MTTVRIDHDIPYSVYNMEYIRGYIQKLPYPVQEVYIRESTGGNTHIKLIVPVELSPLDELLIRAIMHDDERRIRGDLERYALNSPVFGLLFDEKKFSNGEHKVCGEWVEITQEIPPFLMD